MNPNPFGELASAYEGFEATAQFPDEAAVVAYRSEMLARSAPQAEFLTPRLDRGSRLLEVGCGNGRLLVELARRGLAGPSLGVDLAQTRIEFARGWATAEGYDELQFLEADVLEADLPDAGFDAALCVTGAFNYFEPAATGAAGRLLERLRSCLVPGGLLCLELYRHLDDVRKLAESSQRTIRSWEELPETDPWRFYLSRLELESENVLAHEKVFVHRHTGAIDEGRRERLRLYAQEEIESMLELSSFSNVESWQEWTTVPYDDAEVMVVTAVAQEGSR